MRLFFSTLTAVTLLSAAALAAPPGYKPCGNNTDHSDLAANVCGGSNQVRECAVKSNDTGGLNYFVVCANGTTHTPTRRNAAKATRTR